MKPLAPALTELYAKRPTVIKPGLKRIEAAVAILGRAELFAVPSVLVGGTNGKGSTTGFLWQLTGALGFQPGLFTSPHLSRFEERIQVYEDEVTEAHLLKELAALKKALPPVIYEDMSFFEVNTLLAQMTFRRLGSELDLLEVGLGGRWDSTNVSDPALSIITSIGLDHQQYLGDTTAKIAFEKAGIMRAGRPTLWGGEGAGDASAIAMLRDQAKEKGADLYEMGRDFGAEGDRIVLHLPYANGFATPWPKAAEAWPSYLRRNFVLAVAAAAFFVKDHPDAEALLRASVKSLDDDDTPVAPSLRGRFETAKVDFMGKKRRLLLDVCHNVDGARAFREALEEKGWASELRPVHGLVAILADKDTNGILDVLRPVLSPLHLYATTSERTWSAANLEARHAGLPFHASFAEAWQAQTSVNEPTVVCGSVHSVGDVMTQLGLLR